METVIRVTIIYLFLVFSLRVLGKREFSQLSPLELVTLLIVPELVAQGLVREDFSLVNALVGTATLFSLVFFSSLLQYRNPKVGVAISGTPSVLVDHGHLVLENLDKERVSPEEVYGELHKTGLERLSQVKWAILETDGRISIISNESQGKTSKPEEKEML